MQLELQYSQMVGRVDRHGEVLDGDLWVPLSGLEDDNEAEVDDLLS